MEKNYSRRCFKNIQIYPKIMIFQNLVDLTRCQNNMNKINKIPNENNFANEECILILRTFLSKIEKTLKIHERIKQKKI